MPAYVDTPLAQSVYTIQKAIRAATGKDGYSSGEDVIIMTKDGITEVTTEISKQTRPKIDAIEKDFLKDIEDRVLKKD